jgi:hypothetical protein
MGTAVLAGVGLTASNALAAAQTYTPPPNPTSKQCSLTQAVQAINTRKAVGACAAGGGSFSSPDIIKLQAGGTYPIAGTLTISTSVNIQSTAANTMAILSQTAAPPSFLGGMIEISTASSAANVTFQDIDLRGMNSGYTRGIHGQGNNTTGILTLTRSWVENFDILGIYLTGISLTATDSAIDSNGSNTEEYGEAALYMGPTGSASVKLSLNHSSVTNNMVGGIRLDLPSSVSTIKNSTISDNWGGDALDVLGPNMELDIFGSTIVLNHSDYLNMPGSGYTYGGVEVEPNVGNIVTIDQTEIDYNNGPSGSEQEYSGILNSMKNSFLGASDDATILKYLGVNITDDDSLIDTVLMDMGGHGQRHPKTHKPLHGSQLIDFTGTPDSSVGTQDQGYRNRCYDFVAGGNKCDVGAVELQKGE